MLASVRVHLFMSVYVWTCVYMWVSSFVTHSLWTRDLLCQVRFSSGRSCREDGRFRGRVSGAFPGELYTKLSYVAIHALLQWCGTARAPGLGGILLSVRVSREDDNAHGIAVASFNAHLIARQDEVEASWYCARIRPETRDVDHSGCASLSFFFVSFVVESTTERLTTI